MGNSKEIWKDIKGYEGLYQISNLGNVKSLARQKNGNSKSIIDVPERILKAGINSRGYYTVVLHKNSNPKSTKVHRLVAETFIENIKNSSSVNHINAIKTDNRVENLEWCSHLENMQHARKLKLINPAKGEGHGMSKLTNQQVITIRNDNRSLKEIAKDYGVSPGLVGFIKRRKNWKHI